MKSLTLSVRLVRWDQQVFPDSSQLLDLSTGQAVQEDLPDACKVGGGHLGQPTDALPRDVGAHHAPTSLAPSAVHQTLRLETFDQARDRTTTEQHLIRKDMHTESFASGHTQLDHDVVFGEGEPVLFEELAIQSANDRWIGPQEPGPGGALIPGETLPLSYVMWGSHRLTVPRPCIV